MAAPFLTAMGDYMDSCSNQYRFKSNTYLLACLALEFYIILTEQLKHLDMENIL